MSELQQTVITEDQPLPQVNLQQDVVVVKKAAKDRLQIKINAREANFTIFLCL